MRCCSLCAVDEDIPPIVMEVNVVQSWAYGLVSGMVVLGMAFGLMCLIFNIVFKNRKYATHFFCHVFAHSFCIEAIVYYMKLLFSIYMIEL